MRNIWKNNFHPWIVNKLNSNMDLQFVLDEYLCTAYVVEYINKTNRGKSSLHRELNKLRNEHPEMDYSQMLRAIGKKSLDTAEICSQEAAWYLLNLHMSEASRKVECVATMWPHEATCSQINKRNGRRRVGCRLYEHLERNVFDLYAK